ncbi:hypothetical protein RXV86_20145 [Alisedimentitalea sp. MJ-SS2]|uniref:hypothetical protein n=1 Tax=Aliisedimentitalea sp. MJ-SS2 TaxID=3049795 RepID=UPI002912AEC0|nr:hypothetical protein [Alisedimentitalea sp. MJ-SS2]MDU8929703.1 hypothetical protein [Alisedimentitalea sp. MJ-SS2]
MFKPRHFLRMARWARNPPSASAVKLVFGIVLVALIIVGIERYIGWPDALTLEKPPRRVNMQPLPSE